MIWFAVAAVLLVSGAVLLWFSRASPSAPLPRPEEPENLFEPYRSPDPRPVRGRRTDDPGAGP